MEGPQPTMLLQTRFISDSNRFDPLRLTAAINKSVTMYSPYLPRGRTGLMEGGMEEGRMWGKKQRESRRTLSLSGWVYAVVMKTSNATAGVEELSVVMCFSRQHLIVPLSVGHYFSFDPFFKDKSGLQCWKDKG